MLGTWNLDFGICMKVQQKRSIKGQVSKVTKYRVNGWAFRENSEVAPTLRLVVNGKNLQTCKADIFREPLQKVHPTGACGFSFVLKKRQALSDEDVVQVFCGKHEISQKIKSHFDEYYFFVHIPKTAGSSFRNMLYKQFEQTTIYPNLNDIISNGGSYFSLKDASEQITSQARPFQLLMGHYPFHTGRLLPKKPTYIVFLRDPVKRAVSHLYHLKRVGKEEFREAPIDEIMKAARWQINNLQVRYMSGRNFRPGKLYLNDDAGKKALAKAKESIDKCDFVGLTEEFKGSVKLLEKMFDWNLGKKLKKNVAPRRHRKVPKDLYEEIKALNELDIELYEYAKKRHRELYHQHYS